MKVQPLLHRHKHPTQMLQFAELALAQELIHNGSSIPYLYYLAVEHYLTKRYENAISHILTAVREYGKDYCLWSLMGHCHHGLQNKVKAKECYGYIVDSYDRPKDIHLVALRFGTYCLQDKNYRQAREIFYDVCKNSPTPASWLGVGIACYMMSRLREAEQALTEANILDNKCPVIWGYLTLISLRSHRCTEFEQCYKQTRRYNLQDKQILQEIKLLQTRLKYPDPMPLPSNST
ncbi:cilia- and flagella-associated protein 70 [Periplaneta americana]|uniref:cilia- and flagella-associated protein 70 n=1 Tax=Periplaneta americana TaxID=6978 RepID=UPI0037E846C2